MKDFFLTVVLIVLVPFGSVNGAPGSPNETSKVQSRQLETSKYEVTCFESPSYCAEEFVRLCPNGYKVDGYYTNAYDHGQITAIIACKDESVN